MKKTHAITQREPKMVSTTPRSCQSPPLPPPPLPQRIFLSYPGCNIRSKRNLRRYCTCGPMLYVKSDAAEVADPISTGCTSIRIRIIWLWINKKNIVNIAAVRRLFIPISANNRRTTLFRFESSRVTAITKMVDYWPQRLDWHYLGLMYGN